MQRSSNSRALQQPLALSIPALTSAHTSAETPKNASSATSSLAPCAPSTSSSTSSQTTTEFFVIPSATPPTSQPITSSLASCAPSTPSITSQQTPSKLATTSRPSRLSRPTFMPLTPSPTPLQISISTHHIESTNHVTKKLYMTIDDLYAMYAEKQLKKSMNMIQTSATSPTSRKTRVTPYYQARYFGTFSQLELGSPKTSLKLKSFKTSSSEHHHLLLRYYSRLELYPIRTQGTQSETTHAAVARTPSHSTTSCIATLLGAIHLVRASMAHPHLAAAISLAREGSSKH